MGRGVLIVAALPQELRPIAGALGVPCPRVGRTPVQAGTWGSWEVSLACVGIGPERAGAWGREGLAGSEGEVLSIGFAGALAPDLGPGDVVTCTEALALTGDALGAPAAAPEGVLAGRASALGLRSGRWLTADRLIRTTEEKRRLAGRSAAIAVDMETAPILAACAQAGRPCLALRVIWDHLEERIHPHMAGLLDAECRVRWDRILGRTLRRPAMLCDLWRMRRKTSACAHALREAVARLLQAAG
jgi:nucleoside phosphorylase